MRRCVLQVRGMHCAACAAAVEGAIRAAGEGVKAADVALLAEAADVRYDPTKTSAEALAKCVDDAGFPCVVKSTEEDQASAQRVLELRIRVKGMHCASCSSAVERALLAVKGVQTAAVALTTEEARVVGAGGDNNGLQNACREAIEACGFDVADIASNAASTSAPAAADDEDADVATVTLCITSETAPASHSAATNAIKDAPGVIKATWSQEGPATTNTTKYLSVVHHQNITGARTLCDLVHERSDYNLLATPHVPQPHSTASANASATRWLRLLKVAVAFALPIIFLSKGHYLFPSLGRLLAYYVTPRGPQLGEVFLFLLTTPLQFGVGWCFYKGAWRSVKRGSSNMDVLVALGTSASYFYSMVSILHHVHAQHTKYEHTDAFETSAMLITFIIAGKYLEARAKERTSKAIATLLKLRPQSAVLLDLPQRVADGGMRDKTVGEIERICASAPVRLVDITLVQRNDILRVAPGSLVPCDGVVLVGSAYIDESMLTGEATPKHRREGDEVVGGTAVSGASGTITIRTTRVGADTALSRIVGLVEKAQLVKAPIQRFADAISARFVPGIVLLSFLTFLVWYSAGIANAYPAEWLPEGTSRFLFALLFGTAVMVVACPCALGLATPTAVMVGSGVGATHGILVKGGDALERASKVTHVCFDKTGTLTIGRPAVMAWCTVSGGTTVTEGRLDGGNVSGDGATSASLRFMVQAASEAIAMLAACAAEVQSSHPLASAILDFCYGRLSGTRGGGASAPPSPSRATSLDEVDLAVKEDVPLLPEAPSPRKKNRSVDATAAAPAPAGSCDQASASTRRVDFEARSCSWLPQPSQFEERPGLGVIAEGVQIANAPPSELSGPRLGLSAWRQALGQVPTAGARVCVGSPSFAASEAKSGALSSALLSWIGAQEAKARTVVVVVRDGTAIAAFAVSDPLRNETPGVVAHLQANGIRVTLLTGDNARTARAVAAAAGIDDVVAEVLPEQKAAAIAARQESGAVVAMVGDGVNDAPALAVADVGVAIGTGADVAVEAADIVLMREGVGGVVNALALSGAVFARIRLNYAFAIGYNLLAIPVAAGMLYPWFRVRIPPWLAGAAMAMSSVSVVVSSLLLRRWSPPPPLSSSGASPPRAAASHVSALDVEVV